MGGLSLPSGVAAPLRTRSGRSIRSRPMTRVFSGIQPTGQQAPRQLHRRDPPLRRRPGPGRGVLLHRRPALDLTCPTTPTTLRENTLDTAATLLAAGLDPDRCTLFVQSHVHEHAEGAWLLGALATYGELRRMTQFKDKSDGQDSVSADLFTYPVLQAADILLYQTDRVPVGDDQRQHLELTRNIAQRFNAPLRRDVHRARGGDPEHRRAGDGPPGADPTRCRRPAARRRARCCVIDPPEVVAKKIRSAVTDSGREVRRGDGKEGIANLIEILSIATGQDRRADRGRLRRRRLRPVQGRCRRRGRGDARPGPRALQRAARRRAELRSILEQGAAHARSVADDTLSLMRQRMGFR